MTSFRVQIHGHKTQTDKGKERHYLSMGYGIYTHNMDAIYLNYSVRMTGMFIISTT